MSREKMVTQRIESCCKDIHKKLGILSMFPVEFAKSKAEILAEAIKKHNVNPEIIYKILFVSDEYIEYTSNLLQGRSKG